MTVIVNLLKSRKFVTALLAVVAIVANEVTGKQVDDVALAAGALIVMTAIFGWSYEDAAKKRAGN